MIKIVSGYSDKGGSTSAFVELTNELNRRGFKTVFYGPHLWHRDKCDSGSINDIIVNEDDILICHYLSLPNRPNAKKVLLQCHEKDLFKVGEVKQYWDEAIFLNDKHREYHAAYDGFSDIIPNLKSNLVKNEKDTKLNIAGVIGSFDENKQTHVSIKRALSDGCDFVYLFGEPKGEYYEKYVKPLLNDKVILRGFSDNKQEMYDSINCVYHSSKSEVACLVKDECYLTGTIFNGNESTDTPTSELNNEEIINKWLNKFI